MLTKREAAIISIYTGIVLGNFSDAQEYAEELMGHPIWIHDFADKNLCEELKAKSLHDFINIQVES